MLDRCLWEALACQGCWGAHQPQCPPHARLSWQGATGPVGGIKLDKLPLFIAELLRVIRAQLRRAA